jgi:fibronectin type 3 domain-containing protein
VTVTGGRLNAANALFEDTFGPKGVGIYPQQAFNPVDTVRLSFDEAIDVSTFGVEDVVGFDGPDGPISVTSVQVVPDSQDQQFDISFATQSSLGSYTIVIGADISDIEGNLLNQDGDETNGEPLEDRFSAEFLLAAPVDEWHFDFGTGSSVVAPGFTEITPDRFYHPAVGFGWLSTGLDSRDTTHTDPVEQDYNFTPDASMTFAVDVEAGYHDVTVVIGHPDYQRDVGIVLEGTTVDTVHTVPGQFAVETYTVNVTDGQLTVELTQTGPKVATINGLDVVRTPAEPEITVVANGEVILDGDTTPSLLDHTDFGRTMLGQTFVERTFTVSNDGIQPLILGPVSLPEGYVLTEGLASSLTAGASDTFTVRLEAQTEGTYAGQISFSTNDADENPFDFAVTGQVVAMVGQFDFGTGTSAVAPGYTEITPNTGYAPGLGYGWLSTGLDSRDTSHTEPVAQDYNFTRDASMTFAVDVTPGSHEVTVVIGHPDYQRDVGIVLEGTTVDTVHTVAGQFAIETYAVEVLDGQLTVEFTQTGPKVATINGLEVVRTSPPPSEPEITVLGGGEVIIDGDVTPSPLDHTDFGRTVLGQTISEHTYTVSNSGTQPLILGPVSLPSGYTLVEGLTSNLAAGASDTFRVRLNAQAEGTYAGQISFSTNDTDENPFDFAITGELVAMAASKFDFGTGSSEVEPGYTEIVPDTAYDPGLGYGWLSTGLDSRETSHTEPLEQDYNFTPDPSMTFAVDVASGAYYVTVVIGHPDYQRDVGIVLEGTTVDTVHTLVGQFAVETYEVGVSDGQLTVELTQTGPKVATINGLKLVRREPSAAGPEIMVLGGGEVILEGDATPSHLDRTDFGRTVAGQSTAEHTFTVSNDGNQVLNLGPVSLPAGYTLTEGLTSSLAAGASDTFTVRLEAQTEGTYAGQISFSTNDADENPFDFAVTGDVVAMVGQFDFGTGSSVVAAGYTEITPSTEYNPGLGYGWLSTGIDSRDTSHTDPVEQDYNFTRDASMTFAVDVADGSHDVTVVIGHPDYQRDVGIVLEGTTVGTVHTLAGEFATETYTVDVSDGQLTVELAQTGPKVATINGLEVLRTQTPLALSAVTLNQPHDSSGLTPSQVSLLIEEWSWSRDKGPAIRGNPWSTQPPTREIPSERSLDWLFARFEDDLLQDTSHDKRSLDRLFADLADDLF